MLGQDQGQCEPFPWSGCHLEPGGGPLCLPSACSLPAFLLKMHSLQTPWLVARAAAFRGLRPCFLSWGSGNISSTKINKVGTL